MTFLSPPVPIEPAPVPGTGQVTREQVHRRTRELAQLSGRGELQVSQADYEQARRELTGESDSDRQEAVLEFISFPAPRPGKGRGRGRSGTSRLFPAVQPA